MNRPAPMDVPVVPPDAPAGPLVQSISAAFRVATLATLVLGLAWIATNFRQVPPDTTAVVLRFGRIADVRSAGILLVWPRPIDEVRLLPGPDRQLSLEIVPLPSHGLGGEPGALSPAVTRRFSAGFGNAGTVLTADGNAVVLDVAAVYRIVDPAAYLLAETHVPAALNRLLRAALVAVSARHKLDDFIVADRTRPGDQRAAAGAALRQEVLDDVARRLAGLGDTGLGVAFTRLDLTGEVPPLAQAAFEYVLTAGQKAEQAIAVARTDAARIRLAADREHDGLLDGARALAAERLTQSHAATDGIAALQARMASDGRAQVLERAYRERLARLLPLIGQVTAVDPGGQFRLILPGAGPLDRQ